MSQQLLACGRLLRVLSFCRNDSTLLLMGRLVGVWPAAAEADVLVLLCCCWTHCCEDAAGQMGAQKDMSAHLRFWEQTNGTYTMQHPPPPHGHLRSCCRVAGCCLQDLPAATAAGHPGSCWLPPAHHKPHAADCSSCQLHRQSCCCQSPPGCWHGRPPVRSCLQHLRPAATAARPPGNCWQLVPHHNPRAGGWAPVGPSCCCRRCPPLCRQVVQPAHRFPAAAAAAAA